MLIITIRTMESHDVASVITMARDDVGFSNPELSEGGFWEYDVLKNWVKNPGDDVLLVAEYDGFVIGFVLARYHQQTRKADWENQFVLEEYRGRGIADELYNNMEKRLREKGAKFISFLVKEDNMHLPFYEKHFGDSVRAQWFMKEL